MSRIVLILFFVFFSHTSFSQSIEHSIDHRLLIKVNPLGSFAAVIPANIEFFIHPQWSIGVNAAYQFISSGSYDNSLDQSGFAIGPEGRFYFVENHKNDFFSKVYISGQYNYEEFSNKTIDRFNKEYNGFIHGLGAGLFIGHQWFYKSRFVMDVYVGPAYYNYVKDEDFDQNLTKASFFMGLSSAKSSGTKVRLGFNIGIRF